MCLIRYRTFGVNSFNLLPLKRIDVKEGIPEQGGICQRSHLVCLLNASRYLGPMSFSILSDRELLHFLTANPMCWVNQCNIEIVLVKDSITVEQYQGTDTAWVYRS